MPIINTKTGKVLASDKQIIKMINKYFKKKDKRNMKGK